MVVLLMDFCDGGDLTKQIQDARKKRQPIPEQQVLRWFTQAIMALKYIHEKHVLHRDLKPGNFFLTRSGDMKMGDFGIAKTLEATLAVAKTQIGTPYYLSPELCLEKPYTWPSDIWAMGCILYELCAQKVPFDATSMPGLVQKIIKGPIPTIPTGYPTFVRELCSQMLDRNQDKRPSPENILQRPEIQAITASLQNGDGPQRIQTLLCQRQPVRLQAIHPLDFQDPTQNMLELTRKMTW